MRSLPLRLSFVLLLIVAARSFAWDAAGHRLIAQLAVEGMGQGAPDFLKDPNNITQIADQATLPDRWRSTHLVQLTHVNEPDHYLDVEDLDAFGLTLETLPPLRYEYIKAMVLAKEKAGDKFTGRPVDEAHDAAKTREWPGFVPYAIVENYGRLQSAFATIRELEQINDPARADQLEMAKENAKAIMGVMAHYVGDASQPLHTTMHHHGWVGDNPNGYTTDHGFHSFIDGGVIRLHHIDAAMVRPLCKFDGKVNAQEPWKDVIAYLDTTYHQVEPLYQLEKSGELKKDKGREFICERLAAGASMLGTMYKAAWDSAAPKSKDVQEFERYDNFEKPAPSAQPAAAPAGAAK